MEELNLRQRTLVYLSRFAGIDPEIDYSATTAITQDGIALALGVTRPHASSILRRMQEKGTVRCVSARLRDSKSASPRKVFLLTNRGLEEFQNLIELARMSGLDEDTLVRPKDVNHCSRDHLESLDDEVMDLVGMLCVLRSNVRGDELPFRSEAIPVDVGGVVSIKSDTRRRIVSYADPTSVRRWHSMAADWCSDHGSDKRERLFHLSRAGRRREATMLASEHAMAISDDHDDETYMIMIGLCHGSSEIGLVSVTCLMAIRREDWKASERLAEILCDIDPCLGGAMMSEITLAMGDVDRAVGMALDSYRGDAQTALALGKSLVMAGRPDEAVGFLRRSRECMVADGCLFRMEEALTYESMAREDLGDGDGADALRRAASCLRRDVCPRPFTGRCFS